MHIQSSLNRYLPILQEFHYNTLISDSNGSWWIPVIKEQFFAGLNGSLGKDTDAMVAVDHHDFGIAVRVDWVVSKADLVTLARCIHDKIYTITDAWQLVSYKESASSTQITYQWRPPLWEKNLYSDSRVGILWDAIPTVKRNNTVETSGKHLNDTTTV